MFPFMTYASVHFESPRRVSGLNWCVVRREVIETAKTILRGTRQPMPR
jgi:hypothetical protein